MSFHDFMDDYEKAITPSSDRKTKGPIKSIGSSRSYHIDGSADLDITAYNWDGSNGWKMNCNFNLITPILWPKNSKTVL